VAVSFHTCAATLYSSTNGSFVRWICAATDSVSLHVLHLVMGMMGVTQHCGQVRGYLWLSASTSAQPCCTPPPVTPLLGENLHSHRCHLILYLCPMARYQDSSDAQNGKSRTCQWRSASILGQERCALRYFTERTSRAMSSADRDRDRDRARARKTGFLWWSGKMRLSLGRLMHSVIWRCGEASHGTRRPTIVI